MDRRVIRENIMQLVFQMENSGNFDFEDQSIIEESAKPLKQKQAKEILAAMREHIYDIDQLISDNIDKWDIDRLPKTDLAILRTALAEICYIDSIPANVSINEAVELAKKYGDDRSYAFVNSVLGKIYRKIENE